MISFTDGTLVDKAKLLDMDDWNKRLDGIAEQDLAESIGYTVTQLRSGFGPQPGDTEEIPF